MRQISFGAVVLLVLLRMSIGWQFLYEGIWKYSTLQTAKPWSARGYLVNARGPYRDHFRSMTGDPNDLDWLDYGQMAAAWDRWHARFLSHYNLDDDQASRLEDLINGKSRYEAELKVFPENLKAKPLKTRLDKDDAKSVEVVGYDEARQRLFVKADQHLLPREVARLKRETPMVSEDGGLSAAEKEKNKINKDFHKALDDLYKRQSRLSYKERLAAALKGDPTRIGVGDRQDAEAGHEFYPGELDQYKTRLARHQEMLADADQDFEHDHLDYQWQEIQTLRAKLVNPIKALDDELRAAGMKLLTSEQIALGPMSPELTQMRRVDLTTIAALTVLGALLVLGLFSRVAAIAGAGMLFSFYLVMPPWPGVPEIPGPEHSLFINKNLIEAVALLAIAFFPTGSWFGLDGLFAGLFRRRRTATTASTESTQKQESQKQTPTAPVAVGSKADE